MKAKKIFVGYMISIFVLLMISLVKFGWDLYNTLPNKIWIILYIFPAIMLLGSFFFMIKAIRKEFKK